MAQHVRWICPPNNSTAGGCIQATYGKWSVNPPYVPTTIDFVNDTNAYYFCGYNCDNISDSYYPCKSFESYTKFDITEVKNFALAEATLYLYFDVGGREQGDHDAPQVKIWYRDPDGFGEYDAEDFPWDTLDTEDWLGYVYLSNKYTQVNAPWGDLTHINTGTSSYVASIVNGNDGWYEIDVTEALSGIFNEGWNWFAIAIVSDRYLPTYPDWDYYNPQSIEQELWTSCFGATTSFYRGSIADYPASKIRACPWLKVTIETEETPPEQPLPGIFVEDTYNVQSVAADSKSLVALAGVSSGNLWITSDGGRRWDILQQFDSSITAIYMDIIKNHNDFPDTATAWVGLYGGEVYKSIDSFKTWSLVKTCSDAIVEIRGSELNSDKVVVGAGNSLYITANGGSSWIQKSYSDVGVG